MYVNKSQARLSENVNFQALTNKSDKYFIFFRSKILYSGFDGGESICQKKTFNIHAICNSQHE